MTYRNSMQIMSAVLENVDYAGTEGLGITQIIRKSNLSHSRLQKLIENLTGSGLINKIEYDKKKELDDLIRIKTNQQLNQYSNIYFRKVKKDTNINEY